CWIALTRNGDYAYTTNTGSNTLTGYKIGRKGRLTRLDDGVTAKTGAAPTDAVVADNRALFVLNRNDGSVGSYRIKDGGALEAVEVVGGLASALRPTGLVVR
ncbi:MAG: beta-propeller fold lactonase family protein, partial [Gemmataceae bacterium]|nr:beta-propeller fold lactonase family protein [Gemmataceae bacterium]